MPSPIARLDDIALAELVTHLILREETLRLVFRKFRNPQTGRYYDRVRRQLADARILQRRRRYGKP